MDIHSIENSALCPENPVKKISIETVLFWLVFGWCALYAGIFLFHGIALTFYPFDVDNNEAFIIYQGQRIAEGSFLYPPLDQPPYLVDNYPPVYPLVLAAQFLFAGPNFFWPRLLSLSSTVLTALLIGLWAYHLTRNRLAAFFGGLAYLSFYHVYDWGSLARVDALGILFSVLAVFLFHKQNSWKITIPFLLLALFTRQTLFAAPLAIFCSLFFSERRKESYTFLAVLAGTGFLLFLILIGLTYGRAWSHLITYNANEFRISDVWLYTRHWIRFYPVWGCVPLLFLLNRHWFNKPDQSSGTAPQILFWYTLFAFGEALLCGKIGSAPNYLLSLVVATSLGLGLLVHTLIKLATISLEWKTPCLFCLLAFVFQMFVTWHWPYTAEWYAHTPIKEDKQAGQYLMLQLKKSPDPVLTDLPGIAMLAGHRPVWQPFICTQLARQKLWDQTPFLQQIETRKFSKAVFKFDLNTPEWDQESFSPEFITAIQRNYIFKQKIGRFFIYEPKS